MSPDAKTGHYPQVDPNPDFPKIEEKILAFWEKEGIFQRSVENCAGAEEFIFYDGPPFANGLPHYGHLLTGFVKDLFARYQTMKGKRVERRFGWDCHGLPAEMGSEKELGISGRQAIMNFGIDKFNDHCRTSVMKYTDEWRWYVTRQARWVDFDNDYKTMDIGFMESVLWAFKQLYDKGYIYEAYRVMPYSWAAETPLSNFETRLDNSYREREDKAVTVAFELNRSDEVDKRFNHKKNAWSQIRLLAWTTTPWTLPSNLALAINKDFEYVIAENENGGGLDIGLESVMLKLYPENCIGKIKGEKLLGLTYKPLFPYFKDHPNSFRILDGSEFVTDADGTGIVHMAPGFGEDDQRVCEAAGIELVCPVDHAGRFTDEIFDIPFPRHPREGGDLGPHGKPPEIPAQGGDDMLRLKGLNVVCENVEKFRFGEANERIIRYLKAAGALVGPPGTIKHNYPHCWRTDQPLIYRAVPSWYVEVTKFRDRMVELNHQNIAWVPEHIRDGLFGKWLEGARDWSISRNRFWGTPIPVWRSKSGKIKVFGSIAELEKCCGKKITDLHRPYIDEIVFSEGGEEFRRVEDVFDCWFESGSMPYGQVHYPFENKDWFESHFPADFIVEYQAQTRGWFYTLMVLSTALFDCAPFKHCICHGVVLDDKGQKLSKRLNNYADPKELFEKFGADALRWFMMSSPVMRGNELYIDKEGKFIRDVVRLAIKPIWNAYNFFCLYANADNIVARRSSLVASSEQRATSDANVMDRYILAKCKQAVEQIEKSLDAYDTPAATEAVSQCFEALNNWYIRRNKERFWKHERDADKQAAYDTLYTVLTTMCRAAAPLLPLTCEEIYKGLTGEESVHLATYPSVIPAKAGIQKELDPGLRRGDEELIAQMDWVRDVCNAALAIRNRLNIRVRQPLRLLQLTNNPLLFEYVKGGSHEIVRNWNYFVSVIKDEINVKEIKSGSSEESITDYATLKLQINSAVLGKRLPEKMKQILPASKKGDWKYSDNNDGIIVAGELLKAENGEYNIFLEPKPEYKDRAQALSTNDALVILDITVTPELEAEGIARDLVRMIQQARKDAGLNVSDRIALTLDAPDAIAKAADTHKAYIEEQTLSQSFGFKKPAKADYVTENTLDDQKVTIAITKCA